MSKKLILYFLAILFIAFLPAMGGYPIFIMKIMCYALFACAFNLLLGFTGLLSFGHAAFFGTASYTLGYAVTSLGVSTLTGIILGVLAAALLGFVVGVLAIKRSGIYFAMITLAMAQMVYFFYLQSSFTGGEDGMQGIPRGSIFGLNLSNDLILYYFILTIFAFGYFVCWRVINSPFGHVLKAIRENQARAISLGYSVHRFKLLAFVLSAALAGLAGSAKTLVFVSVTLSDAAWQMSGLVVLMTLIGGLGTFTGPVLGALIVVLLENKVGDIGRILTNWTGIEAFQILGQSVTIVIGLIFIICVMAFRRGIVGELVHWMKIRKRSKISPSSQRHVDVTASLNL